MEPEVITTADLLEKWREATRAADLAERLSVIAADAADVAERGALAADEIATLAESAAQSAERAASVARQAATRAQSFATETRSGRHTDAVKTATEARVLEAAARDRYHEAEAEHRERQGRS